jgi:PKD repeat protein
MFTPCQVKLMQYVMESSQMVRRSLYTESNLITTGVLLPSTVTGKPIANFNASTTVVCVGDEVQFYDESCKQIVENRKWTLNGASISTTNSVNPKVTYSTAGNYEVTLTVSNSRGEDTKTIANYIKVRPNKAQISYIEEDAEDDSYLNEDWFTPEVNGLKWGRTSETAYTGNSCFKLPITSSSTIGSKHYIDLPPIDLRTYQGINPKISFMVGYRRSSSTEFETLRILVSTDCGQSYQQKKQVVGAGLSTSGALTNNFVPSSQSDWRRINYNLSDFENDSNLLIRIEIESAATNTVFLDDINVSQFYTGLEGTNKPLRYLSVYPNPNNGEMKIELDSKRSENTEINLLDLMGKKVSTLYIGKTKKGLNTFEVSNKGNIASGVYYLQVTIGGISNYEKVSILK